MLLHLQEDWHWKKNIQNERNTSIMFLICTAMRWLSLHCYFYSCVCDQLTCAWTWSPQTSPCFTSCVIKNTPLYTEHTVCFMVQKEHRKDSDLLIISDGHISMVYSIEIYIFLTILFEHSGLDLCYKRWFKYQSFGSFFFSSAWFYASIFQPEGKRDEVLQTASKGAKGTQVCIRLTHYQTDRRPWPKLKCVHECVFYHYVWGMLTRAIALQCILFKL